VAELTTEDIDKITSARMDPEHDHLNTLLHEQACCEKPPVGFISEYYFSVGMISDSSPIMVL
jgi:hypothetical protein